MSGRAVSAHAEVTALPAAPRRERDLRLDFFRGLAMFIILIAHIPDDSWALWIPARFGFSDATEIFVFCSGMASGIAFGAIFLKRGWLLGAARIAYRVWQVYWAHVGVFLAVVLLVILLDRTGMGGRVYADWPPVAPVFTRTADAFLGLFTLSYVPGLFDILPMYLVILALIPVVMGAYLAGGRWAAFALIGGLWLAANLAGWARITADADDLNAVQAALAWAGRQLSFLNLPGSPWSEHTWFFNPFAWQLVFFTGFALAMGWVTPPPVTRWLVLAALAVVVVTVPLAWYKVYEYYTGYLPERWGGAFFWEANAWLEPLRWKTWVGAWRYLHFLALAYLAWALVGPGGVRLRTGWQPPARGRGARVAAAAAAGAVLLATLPYTYIPEIKALAPALDRWFVATIPTAQPRWIGLLMLVHLGAALVFVWNAIGDRARRWLLGDAFTAAVPVIRKVGTQSLAVFMVSLVLARFSGWWMDVMSQHIEAAGYAYLSPRDAWMQALVNLTGFAVLIATAYTVAWFKRQPWRERPPARDPAPRRELHGRPAMAAE